MKAESESSGQNTPDYYQCKTGSLTCYGTVFFLALYKANSTICRIKGSGIGRQQFLAELTNSDFGLYITD